MNLLILQRHGAYTEGENRMNHVGALQASDVSTYIRTLINDVKRLNIISSEGPRAKHMAELLSLSLKVPYVIKEGLLVDIQADFRPSALDISLPAVIVTRCKYIICVSKYYSNMFGCEDPMLKISPDGDAFMLIIDFDKRMLKRVDFEVDEYIK